MALSSFELMEVTFNSIYLVIVYYMVFLMYQRREIGFSLEPKIGKLFFIMFLLLALGDTGHVGFRVIALLNGGLEANSTLVGFGALSTSITITIFYMLFLEVWRVYFNKEKDLIYYLILVAGVIRLLIFFFPQNEWGNVVPPYTWSLIRNAFLTIQGVALAYFIFRDRGEDIFMNKQFWSIVVSYAFYVPVILFVQKVPEIGMLMIPKTIAYLFMAYFALKEFFKSKA